MNDTSLRLEVSPDWLTGRRVSPACKERSSSTPGTLTFDIEIGKIKWWAWVYEAKVLGSCSYVLDALYTLAMKFISYIQDDSTINEHRLRKFTQKRR